MKPIRSRTVRITLATFLIPFAVSALAVAAGSEPPSPPEPAPAPPVAPYVFAVGDPGEVDVRFFANGYPSAYLGVHVVELTPELCEHFGVDAEGAVMVSRRTVDGPAEAAGLEVGDIITGIDGKPVRGSWELRRQIARREAEEIVLIDVVRDGRRDSVRATLGRREGVPRVDLGNLRPLERVPFPEIDEKLLKGEGKVLVWGDDQRRAFERAIEELREGRVLERLEEAEEKRQRAHEDRMRALEERHREVTERLRELERRLQERER